MIPRLSEYIEHFHLADIKDRRHYHLIPGLGSIDFKTVFESMEKINYNGFVTVELYPYKNNPIEAASTSINFLNSISNPS